MKPCDVDSSEAATQRQRSMKASGQCGGVGGFDDSLSLGFCDRGIP